MLGTLAGIGRAAVPYPIASGDGTGPGERLTDEGWCFDWIGGSRRAEME
jgi:hypothetical protein